MPFATAGALTDTAFDVRKHVIEKTFPRGFNLKSKRFAAVTLHVDKANKLRFLRRTMTGRGANVWRRKRRAVLNDRPGNGYPF